MAYQHGHTCLAAMVMPKSPLHAVATYDADSVRLDVVWREGLQPLALQTSR